MYKKTITYPDFNGVERTEDFYFNLTEAEITDMQLGVSGGLAAYLDQIIKSKNEIAIINIFKKIIRQAYGVKSPDGRRFMKSEEIWKEFAETPAYSMFYMELGHDAEAAAEFVNGITPASISVNAKPDEASETKVIPMNPAVPSTEV